MIDLSECVECDACVELCHVFRKNDAGYIEVVEQSEYPLEEIEECIKYYERCPNLEWKTIINILK